MGIGVTVARLTLTQLVKVQILDPQFSCFAAAIVYCGSLEAFPPSQRGVHCSTSFYARQWVFLPFCVHFVETVMWICIALCVVLGVPFTLLWWRDMDKWADAEHRKFKPKVKKPLGPTVLIRTSSFNKSAEAAGPSDQESKS